MDLSGKKIAVYGLGVSGLGAITYLRGIALDSLVIVNKGEGWESEVGAFSYPITTLSEGTPEAITALSQVDLILLAPGIPRSSETLREAHANKIPIWNELELASRFFLGPIIALTGTNGKTTSVSFLEVVLKELGFHPFVGGNIGRSFLEGLSTKENFDVALLEVSSFQCESLDQLRAEVAGILNLFPNHGERYDHVEDYRLAKWLLARPQKKGDHFFVGPGCGAAPEAFEATIHPVLEEELSEHFDISTLKIVGEHNRFNLWFCWRMIKAFCDERGLEARPAFERAMISFKGVEHRIEYVGTLKKNSRVTTFYNDAKSTNWQATLTAMKAVSELGQKVSVLIGGQLRGHNDEAPKEIVEFLKEHPSYKVFLYGESRKLLEKSFNDKGDEEGVVKASAVSLEEVVELAKEHQSDKEEVILLSPAFPSFDQFKNYAQRGKRFKELTSSQ
jgi:UDP-N-acetylmuramoylalanine--D-glutamate ligase